MAGDTAPMESGVRDVRTLIGDALVEPVDSCEDTFASGRAYLRALAPGGWLAPTWASEYGGRSASDGESIEINRVLQDFPKPDLYPFFVGLNMVGPTLIRHGNADQKNKLLRRIISGEDIWCQMFSEPEAGSDLANVALRATADGETWRLNGQKVWTSRAHYATHGLCLARTDPTTPKHQGMSMFIVPMRTTGVEIRPLIQMNGDSHFCEVFLTDVEVNDAERVGELGQGWSIAHTMLSLERSAIGKLGRSASRSEGSSTRLPSWLSDLSVAGKLENKVLRDKAVAIFIETEVTRLTAARAATLAKSGRPGPEGSGGKLRGARVFKRRAYLIKEAFGAHGMLTTHQGHDDAITAPSMSIRGGTDEIQLNIIAEKILNLPAEPHADRDVPWSRSRKGET